MIFQHKVHKARIWNNQTLLMNILKRKKSLRILDLKFKLLIMIFRYKIKILIKKNKTNKQPKINH
jgi:hypothetical protein